MTALLGKTQGEPLCSDLVKNGAGPLCSLAAAGYVPNKCHLMRHYRTI